MRQNSPDSRCPPCKRNLSKYIVRTAFMVSSTTMIVTSVTAQVKDPHIYTVEKGQSAALYFEINLKGTVYVKLGAKPGESNCAEFWWIIWPLGNIKSLGRHCGTASFKIPGVFDLAFSSKLRVGATDNQVKIAISASESLANSASFGF